MILCRFVQGSLIGLLCLVAIGCAAKPGPGPAPSRTAVGERPVASPVIGASTVSRVTYAIRPLGLVDFDEQVLPIPSPDGTRLAVEVGQPPSWDALLAEAGSSASSTSVAIYDITGVPSMVSVPESDASAGLLLGRASDDRGVLVESPRPDGARWIGRMDWVTGQISWLATGTRVNAHGVLTPEGTLVFVAADLEGGSPRLTVLDSQGRAAEFASDNLTPLYPIACDDPTRVVALVLSRNGMELVAIRLARSNSGGLSLGPIVFRSRISTADSMAAAHQIAEPSVGAMTGSHGWNASIIWHPGLRKAVEVDFGGGPQRPLGEGSVSAVRWQNQETQGYFVTGPDGLKFQPRSDSVPSGTARLARVIDVPAVARATRSPDRPLILLAPSRQRGRLEVSVLIPGLDSTP